MSETISFGKYRLIAELGHGGMADVFLAVHEGMAGFSKLQVIKRLREHLADDAEFVAMLVDEARIAARLNHPNIVQTNEVGEVGGRYFIAMEYLNGQPLHRIQSRAAKSAGGMSLDLMCVTLVDTLKGLHHAHELADYDGTPLNVVHRDMTPHNIFLTYDGISKVVDFGIAKAAGRAQETRLGVIKGKIRYMAPEQALGRDIDRRADIFAVGIMLWEAVAKRRLWIDKDDPVVLRELVAGKYPASPRVLVPDADPTLAAICAKALAFDPNDRFANAEALATAIEEYVGDRAADVRRKLGPMVAELFADRRAELKRVVEHQLSDRGVRSNRSPLGLAQLTDSSSGTASRQVDLPPSQVAAEGASAIDVPIHVTVVEAIAPRKRARVITIATAGLGAALVGLAVWASTRSSVPAAAATVNTAPAVELINVSLRASPAVATFHLDDGPALQNPYVMRAPKDGQPHTVRVEAPGYRTKTQSIHFAADVVVDLSLDSDIDNAKPRVPVASAAPNVPSPQWHPAGKPAGASVQPATNTPQPEPGPHPSAASASPAPTLKHKDSAKIDQGDPWAN